MNTLQHVTVGDPLDTILDALDRDGAVIVEQMLTPQLTAAFRADMERHAAEVDAGTRSPDPAVREFWGATTKRFTGLARRSPRFVDVLLDPTLLAVSDALLLPSCSDYWMNTGQMMVIGPGEDAQILHRDADNWRSMNRPDGFEVTVSCMFAISEFTAAGGATRVVPGSHRWDDYTVVPDVADSIAAEMPAGSGLIYTGRVLHGGGANVTSDVWRYGLHLSFVLGWLTPEEASPLAAPWDVAGALPARAQRLLGWRCYDAGQDDGSRLWTVDYEDVPVGLGLETSDPT